MWPTWQDRYTTPYYQRQMPWQMCCNMLCFKCDMWCATCDVLMLPVTCCVWCVPCDVTCDMLCDKWCATCDMLMLPVTCYVWCVPCDVLHVTCNMSCDKWCATCLCYVWNATCDMNPIRSPEWVQLPEEPKRNISKDLVKFYLLIQLSDFPTHRPDSHWCSKSGSPSVLRTTTDGS